MLEHITIIPQRLGCYVRAKIVLNSKMIPRRYVGFLIPRNNLSFADIGRSPAEFEHSYLYLSLDIQGKYLHDLAFQTNHQAAMSWVDPEPTYYLNSDSLYNLLIK